jgi:phage FluMu gp28-like protein
MAATPKPAAPRPKSAARTRVVRPRDTLLPWQARWVADQSRFKIGLTSRQIGKSTVTAEEAVNDCLARKTDWVALSAGERQSLEWLRKAREWTEAYQVALAGYTEDRPGGSEALLKAAEIQFPNGSRILAVPANPATVRGYAANLVLDEFAHHEQPDAIWRAIYPSISNPLRGQFLLRVVSTANGRGNKFADLWDKAVRYPAVPGRGQWSGHKVTIHDAVRDGLPVDVEELRAGLDDPEAWSQEYECEFLDSAAILLPYELLAQIEHPLAVEMAPPDWWASPGDAPLYAGLDFGRKRNLSVLWTLQDIGAGAYHMTREVLTMQGLSTPAQFEILRHRLPRIARLSMDYTGPGVGLGDLLVQSFGEYDPAKHRFGKVELCTFSQALKCEIFPRLRSAAESKRLGIPVSRVIREDLHSVHRVTTATGGITYRAPMTDDGHADRCTALALAVRAASFAGVPGRISVPASQRTAALARRRRRTVH